MSRQLRSLGFTAGLLMLLLVLRAAPAMSAAEIVSITSEGAGCVQAQVDMTGEILGGEVSVEGRGVAPDRITFFVLNTACDPAVTFEFLLNGTSLGTFLSDETFSCSCQGPPGGEMAYTITDPALLAAWNPVSNTLQFRIFSGGRIVAVSYVRAELESGGQIETVCVADFNSLCNAGSCESGACPEGCGPGFDVCEEGFAFTGGFDDCTGERRELDESVTFPNPFSGGGTGTVSAPYSGCQLPGTVDIADLPDGVYRFCVSTQEEVPVLIDEIRLILLNTRCGGAASYTLSLNGVSLGTAVGDPGFTCTCAPPIRTFSFTNPSLLANWQNGTNTLRLTKPLQTDGNTALAWAKVEIVSAGDVETVCLFDFNGGGCAGSDLCSAGYTWGFSEAEVTTDVFSDRGEEGSTVVVTSETCASFTKQGQTCIAINTTGCEGGGGPTFVRVSGNVTSDCGDALTGTTVTLTDGGGNLSTATVATNGIYSFENVLASSNAGTVTVGVPACFAAGAGGASRSVSLSADATADFQLACVFVAVSGTLTSDCGDLLPGVAVSLTQDAGATVVSTTTSAEGAYTFSGIRCSDGTGEVSFVVPAGFLASNPDDAGAVVSLAQDQVADFGLSCIFVTINGTVSSDCQGGLAGVTVDLVREGANPDVWGGVSITSTDADGSFSFEEIRFSDADGDNISITIPLGFQAVSPADGAALVSLEQDGSVNFVLQCNQPTGVARSMGYWKHQANVYISGRGNAQESQVDMTTNFPSLLFNHFHENLLNGIEVEGVTFLMAESGPTTIDLVTMQRTLTVNQNGSMLDRAKQQYLAFLLNMASGKLLSYSVVSADGATASQALQYVAALIGDGDPSNDERAKDVCDRINNAQQVAAGVIPLDIENIVYKLLPSSDAAAAPGEGAWLQVSPNPGYGTYAFALNVPAKGTVTLAVYDATGRRVANLLSQTLEAGSREVVWDGESDTGGRIGQGVYFARLTAPDGVRSVKFVHMNR
jgi:FlgD Ig-like domain